MSAQLVAGDPGSCSQLGSVLRREAARLSERRLALAGTQGELAAWTGPAGDAARGRLARQLVGLAAAADALDDAGAAVQRYATELSEARELGRRAEQAAADAGLRILDARVVEPWGVATSADAGRRLAELPHVQAMVSAAEAAADETRRALAQRCLQLTETLASLGSELRSG